MKKQFFIFFFLICHCFVGTNTLSAWDSFDEGETSSGLWGARSYWGGGWGGGSWLDDLALEARVAYYQPSSRRVRKIYRDGWPDYQLELSKAFGLGCECEKNIKLWVGVSGFSVSGRSRLSCYNHSGGSIDCSSFAFGSDCSDHGIRRRTSLRMIPVSLGIKYIFNHLLDNFLTIDPCLNLYVGAAACYSSLRIRDHDEYLHRHVHKNAWGGLIQSGVYYYVNSYVFVSAFADYLFQRFRFSNHHRNYSSHIERHDLTMDGYKLGVGIGVTF